MSQDKQTAGETAMQTFTFNANDTAIRVEMIDGNPWFVAKDVCDALTIEKHRDAVSRLDDDERGSVVVDTLGGKQSVSAVNESGLYNLIFQSRKAEAKAFRKWVTGEVLPSIRKTGGFRLRDANGDIAHRRALANPRDRSAQLGDFYRELQLWTRSADVDEVAEMAGCKRDTVMKVRRGTKTGLAILELLVAYAKENRRERRLTDIVPPQAVAEDCHRRLEQLRIDFMEEGGAR